MPVYIPQEGATNRLNPANMCTVSPDVLVNFGVIQHASSAEEIAQYICLNNQSIPVRIIPPYLGQEQVDPMNFCPEFAPETVCIINSSSGLDLDGDGHWDASFDGSGNFTGVAPGKLFNYSKLARYIWEHNNRIYTPGDAAYVDSIAIQLSGAIFPHRNQFNEIVSSSGERAKFSMPINDAQYTVDDPLHIGERIGVNVAFTSEFLSAAIDFDGAAGQQEYDEYVKKLAEQQNGGGDIGGGIIIAALILVIVGGVAVTMRNRAKMENQESEWQTGFGAHSAEALLAAAVKEELGGKFPHEYIDAIASAARQITLGKFDTGMQSHVIAKQVISQGKSNPKN